MMRQAALFFLLVAGAAATQQNPKVRGADSRDSSSYSSFSEPQYPSYPPYPYTNGHKYDIGSIFTDIQLPTVKDVITGIVYVLAVASVAGLVLVGVFLILKVLGLKLPIITDLKKQVLSKVDKVDARMLESAWDMLQNAYEKYQTL